ncbi:MAG: hypothetical protein NTZ74_09750 [Chloroflexi bacterium]|nr:hypothetical protein [Chloroflexota bacterium]
MSTILSAASLVLFYLSIDNKKKLIIPLVALAFSNAYINYSTSGLENALLNFLFSSLFFVYVKKQNLKHFSLYVYLLISLIALTRIDALLVVLPILINIFFIVDKSKFWRKSLILLLGFSPLILWELFSLFYYGFPFPNTFYAKLTAGFPIIEYLQRGVSYFFDTLSRDPITFIGLLAGCAAVFFLPKRVKPLSLGIFLYIFFVFYIGGDFMPGRMYASIFFLSMLLITQVQRETNVKLIVATSGILIFIGFLADCPTPLMFSAKLASNTNSQIIDQRRLMMGGTSLFRNGHLNSSIEMDGKIWGFGGYNWIADEREAGTLYEMPVFIWKAIGLFGYFGGQEIRIIDQFALSDPLLARLPAFSNPNWRVGHLERYLPEGYPQSIADPKVKLADKQIEEYNNHLKVLTQSKLFSKGRLLEILRFNIGYYDYLLK